MAQKHKERFTFEDKVIEDLENLLEVNNAEQKLQRSRKYTEEIRNRLNYYRCLLQYLEMYLEWSEKEIDGKPILDIDWQTSKQFWIKDGFYRTSWWRKRRQEIIERDNHNCQNCGLTQEEQKELGKTGRGLEVHHIEPRLSFHRDERDKEGVAHKKSNLITLCTKCHARLETMKPSKQREKLGLEN